MAVSYRSGPWGNAGHEVDQIDQLRARCDNDLQAAIDRCERNIKSVKGADPISERRTCGICKYWLTTFCDKSSGAAPAALVASFRDRAGGKTRTENVIYAVLTSAAPSLKTLDANMDMRIEFDP